MESGDDEPSFERHVAEARNIHATEEDPYPVMILNQLVEDRVGGANKGNHQFDCAEPHAVANLALLNVPLEHIKITSIQVADGSNKGQSRKPCRNCRQWLELDDGGYVIKQTMLDNSWRPRYRIGMGRMSGEALKASLSL
jgi:hypothetical protein